MEQRVISVLIIDDEPLLRRSLADFLADEGQFDVHVAADAEEGLAFLAQRMVDVCLVDLRLPGVNGIEFMLRAQVLGPDLRFIIHTGSPGEQLPMTTLQGIAGYRGVLFKPVSDMDAFLTSLHAALD